jgi:lysozyme
MYDLIKKYEGFRAEAYPDPATEGEPWTIGHGTTRYPDGRKVQPGDTCTREEAERYLNSFVDAEIMPHIKGWGLSGGRLEAVVSLIYNVGWPAFGKSKLRAAIKAYAHSGDASDLAGICKEWDFWFAAGRPMKGLIKRRVAELATFVEAA